MARNAIMLQCMYLASIYNDLLLYKHNSEGAGQPDKEIEAITYTVGIIGCGQIGTMLLTKLLEAQSSFQNLRVIVSTRQPHLLRPFKEEFGITTEFNNEKVVYESDIVFLCVAPGQATEVLKELKFATMSRVTAAQKNPKLSPPLFVSCLAATGIPKLKLMLCPEAAILRTRINVGLIRRYLQVTQNDVP